MNPYGPNNDQTVPIYAQNPYPPAKRSIFRWYWRQHLAVKIGIGCPVSVISLFVALFLVLFLVFSVKAIQSPSPRSASTSKAPTTAHVIQSNTPTATHAVVIAPTATQTPTPTAEPPTPTPVPVVVEPTQPPVQVEPTQPPAPTCSGTLINGGCYNYDPAGGSLVYSPPSNFCSYYLCVSSFWTSTNGYVARCSDGKHTHSGGVSGACSKNGGVVATLYQH
jgi:hypothetical protein